jgi:calcineurin-like phosphoesterase family protein
MNECIISRWNETVNDSDTVYVEGDVFMKMKNSDAIAIMKRLKGKKCLIPGNHEKLALQLRDWEWIRPYHEMTDEGVNLVLCHYPFKCWNKLHYGSINLYGHVHARMRQFANQIDVGVDAWDFRPMPLVDMLRATRDLPVHVSEDYPADMHRRIAATVTSVIDRAITPGQM